MRLHKQGRRAQLLHHAHQFRQLRRGQGVAGFPIDHAYHVQPVGPGEVGEGLVKGDDILAGQVCQPGAQLFIQGRQTLGIGGAVGLNGRGILRKSRAQTGAQVVHHGYGVGGVQP